MTSIFLTHTGTALSPGDLTCLLYKFLKLLEGDGEKLDGGKVGWNGEKGGGVVKNGNLDGVRRGAENDFETEDGEGGEDDEGVELERGSPGDLKRSRGLFMPHHTLRAATSFFSRFPLYDNTVIPY